MTLLSATRSPTADVSVDPIALDWQPRLLGTLVVLDGLAALLAVFGAVAARDAGGQALGGVDYRWLALTVPFGWLVVLALSGAYEKRVLGCGSEEFRRVANAGVRLLAALVLIGFVLKLDTSRSVLLGSVAGTVCLAVFLRWVARQVLHGARRHGHCAHRTLIVGEVHDVWALTLSLRRARHAGFDVIGVCMPGDGALLPDNSLQLLGAPHEAAAVARRVGADTVAVAGSGSLGEHGLRRLAWSLEGAPVDLLVAPGLTDIAGPRVAIRPVDGVPLLQVEAPQFTGWRRVVKGLFDRVSAVTLLVLLAVPLGMIALAVRLTTPGPAFFRQTRVGRGGQLFRICKFRTMHLGADREQDTLTNDTDGVLFKLRADPRVTPLGRFLRRWSIDELPQLWNVVRGEMSLVGPRPPIPAEVERYAEDVHRRLLVKPGLSGLWQVSGRSNLSWEESVRLDLRYVENWSVTLDLVILARTITAVFRGSGAY